MSDDYGIIADDWLTMDVELPDGSIARRPIASYNRAQLRYEPKTDPGERVEWRLANPVPLIVKNVPDSL